MLHDSYSLLAFFHIFSFFGYLIKHLQLYHSQVCKNIFSFRIPIPTSMKEGRKFFMHSSPFFSCHDLENSWRKINCFAAIFYAYYYSLFSADWMMHIMALNLWILRFWSVSIFNFSWFHNVTKQEAQYLLESCENLDCHFPCREYQTLLVVLHFPPLKNLSRFLGPKKILKF